MSKIIGQVIDFKITAQFLGVILKDGYRVKYLRVNVSTQEYWVKLPKDLSQSFDQNLNVGSWLEICGTQALDRKKGILKLEASSFRTIESSSPDLVTDSSSHNMSVKKNVKPACILICQKSDCWQSGGKEIYRRLEQGLSDRGISDLVQIQKTGCQKQCNYAPNLVVMPSKVRHSRVKPSQIDGLLNSILTT